MKSPQLKNGYVKIANEILEAMAKCNCFGYSNGQVITAILRKTYGWNKKEDKISISQLANMTALSKRTVIYALQELEAKKIIIVTRGIKDKVKDINLIKFNKNYSGWVVQNSSKQVIANREKARGSAKLRRGSAKPGNLVVQNYEKDLCSFAHTKDTTTKDINKRKSKPDETELDKAIADFEEMRKKIKHPLTNRAKELLLRELEKLAPGNEKKKIDIINQSILRSWRGIFELKDTENKPKQSSTREVPLI